MAIVVGSESWKSLDEYTEIPSSFVVRSRWRADGSDEPVDPPYVKDYDAAAPGPANCATVWDVLNWRILLARDGSGGAAGGAVVARSEPGPFELDGRSDLAALVDLRVRPEKRREGIGRMLVRA